VGDWKGQSEIKKNVAYGFCLSKHYYNGMITVIK